MITFHIDGDAFYADETLLAATEFTLQSVPRPYQVSLQTKTNPIHTIQAYLEANPKNLLLIDEVVFKLYGHDLYIDAKRLFLAPADENFKTLDGLTKLLDFMQAHEFTKAEQLIVVGGGIIQDIAAFVGAVYKRGIAWVYFPTTLLSMCDSCIGGKTGINYQGVKNQLALFSAPRQVIINTEFLSTLNSDALYCGLGEILKLCIMGGDFFVKLYQSHVHKGNVTLFSSYQTLILAALAVKKAVVEADEFELHHRKSLNYGHTLGHAVEVLSHYKIAHGQAVVVGMILVNALSQKQGLLKEADVLMLNQLCFDLLDVKVLKQLAQMHTEPLLALIKKDKKALGQMMQFVLLKSLGDIHLVKLKMDEDLQKQIDHDFAKAFHQ